MCLLASDDFGIAKSLQGGVFKGYEADILPFQKGNLLKALPYLDHAVAHGEGNRLVLGALQRDGDFDPRDLAVFKGDVGQGTVTAPLMAEGQAHHRIGIFKGAIAKEIKVGGTSKSRKDPDIESLPPMAAAPNSNCASKAPSKAANGFPQRVGS